jgi:transcriptional regulator with XRE-family HTH domain/tetratricopeptide (TPR) repeat protein
MEIQADTKHKQPNYRLRYEREARGWTQQYVAKQLDADMNIVSRWECGDRKPGLYYRQKLIELFGKSAVELGLVEAQVPPEMSSSTSPHLASTQAVVPGSTTSTVEADLSLDKQEGSSTYSSQIAMQSSLVPGNGNPPSLSLLEVSVGLMRGSQSLDLLYATAEGTREQHLGAWLALGASDLVQLFEEGWTPEEVFTALHVLQKAVQIVSRITRRRLFEIGAPALVNGILIPTGKHISVEERTELHQALSECIGEGWKLFVTASMPLVLAVGQAQLQLLHQTYAELYPSVRPLFYSPVYRLIGAALFFQSRYREALQAHSRAYLTALEAGDSWNMAESLSWQAGVFKACGRHMESIQTTEAALRLLNGSHEAHIVASQARLLAQWAESAALSGERSVMEEKLSASAELLTQCEGNDEFDAAIWHYYRGTCTLYIGDPSSAEQYLEHALRELRPNLLHQRASTALLLAQARLKMGEWEGALIVARDAVPLVVGTTSPLLDRGLVDLVEHFMVTLPKDTDVKDLVEAVQQHSRLHAIHMQQRVPRYLEAIL